MHDMLEVPAIAASTFSRSSEINELATALAKAQGAMEAAAKANINPHFKSKYADLASVWDACREPLSRNGLAVLQPVCADGASVTVTTILAHSSGQWISEALTLTAQQNTPQGVGSAITYGRRYGLSSMVGIAADDDDGNAASARPAAQVEREAPRAPDGFENWLTDMHAVAENGGEALEAAWSKSRAEYRRFINEADKKALKLKASKAKTTQEVGA